MMNSYFDSEERFKRYQEMRRTDDYAGMRRMKFGETIYNLRRLTSPESSQEQAADRAGITRIQWNRIENGHVRPLPATIPGIADALNTSRAVMFILAGFRVPKEDVVYDRKLAHRRLDDALDDGGSRDEFHKHMDLVWEEEQQQQMSTILGRLPETITYRPKYAELLAQLLEHLTVVERVQLALELVESSYYRVVDSIIVDQAGFYETIGKRLEECRYDLRVPQAHDDSIF